MHISSLVCYHILPGDSHNKKVFCLQKKKIIHLIFGIKGHASCKNSFKAHQILTKASIYILKVLCFMKKYHMTIKYNFHLYIYNTSCSLRLYQIFKSKQCFTYAHKIV
jgi:hypothetical protein